jgi:hypothetical protein
MFPQSVPRAISSCTQRSMSPIDANCFRSNRAPLLDRVEIGVPQLLCECHLDDAAVESIDAPDIVDKNTRRRRIAYLSTELDHVDSSGWDSAAPHPSPCEGRGEGQNRLRRGADREASRRSSPESPLPRPRCRPCSKETFCAHCLLVLRNRCEDRIVALRRQPAQLSCSDRRRNSAGGRHAGKQAAAG